MSYDTWLEPPDPTFGVCANCGKSEEDHMPVTLEDESGEIQVCPTRDRDGHEYQVMAVAISEDYPADVVYDAEDNELLLEYESAMDEIDFNSYLEDESDY